MHLSIRDHYIRSNEAWQFQILFFVSANQATISSDSGLLPARQQAIIGTEGGILLISPLGTNFRDTWRKTRWVS